MCHFYVAQNQIEILYLATKRVFTVVTFLRSPCFRKKKLARLNFVTILYCLNWNIKAFDSIILRVFYLFFKWCECENLFKFTVRQYNLSSHWHVMFTLQSIISNIFILYFYLQFFVPCHCCDNGCHGNPRKWWNAKPAIIYEFDRLIYSFTKHKKNS